VRAARELVVVEGHVSVRAAVPVRVDGGFGDRARVMPRTRTFALPELLVACDALTLDDTTYGGGTRSRKRPC
jgi:hypothetical protein